MTTQRCALLEGLHQYGWDVIETRGPDPECWIELEWWADEVWLLKPHGQSTDHCIYLTFVVDPSWEGEHRNNRGVWAVTASLEGPQKNDDIFLSLPRGWQERLRPFLTDLSRLYARQAPGDK